MYRSSRPIRYRFRGDDLYKVVELTAQVGRHWTSTLPQAGDPNTGSIRLPQELLTGTAFLACLPLLPPAMWWCTITAVRSPRWPATAPPPCGGGRVHGHRLLSAHTHLTLELTRITAYPSGLAVQLALTATGWPARRAGHETRPLTDPADPSARWSYLEVWAGTDDLAVADPYFPRPDLQAVAAGICTYRSEPLYWLPVPLPVRTVTLTAEWPQIGLPASVTTVNLAVIAPQSTPRRS